MVRTLGSHVSVLIKFAFQRVITLVPLPQLAIFLVSQLLSFLMWTLHISFNCLSLCAIVSSSIIESKIFVARVTAHRWTSFCQLQTNLTCAEHLVLVQQNFLLGTPFFLFLSLVVFYLQSPISSSPLTVIPSSSFLCPPSLTFIDYHSSSARPSLSSPKHPFPLQYSLPIHLWKP